MSSKICFSDTTLILSYLLGKKANNESQNDD